MTFQQFQEEFKKIKNRFPVRPTHNNLSENCEYGDYLYKSKNCQYSFDNSSCENTIYVFDSFKAVNCYDGDYVIESQNCYECSEIVQANNCTYLTYSVRIYDAHFCWDCADSHHLFGCVHLKNKAYCIFNKQYTKDEYEKKIKELIKRPAEENLKDRDKTSFLFPVTSTNVSKSENAEYNNQVHYNKNAYLCFDSTHSNDCAYMYDAHYDNNCFDITQSFRSDFAYECVDCARLNRCFFMNDCDSVYDSAFCELCNNSHHVFGCYGLDHKEYCILNKQYTKEEYEKLRKEIMTTYAP